MPGRSIALDPLVPLPALAVLAGLGLVLVGLAAWRRARGWPWRLAGLAILAGALLNPSWQAEQRQPIADIGLIVVDESASQRLTDRLPEARRLLAKVRNASAGSQDLNLRVVKAESRATPDGQATQLMASLREAAAQVPRRRLAGAVLITDGRVHDAGQAPQGIGPIHVLLTGERDSLDRRLKVVDSPAYRRVGETATITVKAADLPAPPDGRATVQLTVRLDGERLTRKPVPLGQKAQVEVPIRRAGRSVVELAVPERDGELSAANNAAAVSINGIRDRLRVLLVSGEPHNGERTWRRTLKADPNVDLVHFTILRPPSKQTDTPIDELSLIAFPIRELFEVRLDEFDLVVFDRYRYRGVLPQQYLANIAEYVRNGGALLGAMGPAYAGGESLADTPLQDVLPARPTGEVAETAYRPRLTDAGRRHPVTAALREAATAGPEGKPSWGRWLRQIEGRARTGTTVMDGRNGQPLMLLDRVGDGRVAQIMSDHMWLWTRGFDGGGPQGPLLRRSVHWLMKEPALEENDLRARPDGRTIRIEQRRLEGTPEAVTLTRPDGSQRTIEPTKAAPGRWTATVTVRGPGLYRLEDDRHSTVAAVGALNPPELQDLRASAAPLAPVAKQSGGLLHWAADGMPRIRRSSGDSFHGEAAGAAWLAWRDNENYRVTGLKQVPLLPAPLVLALALAALLLGWWRESR